MRTVAALAAFLGVTNAIPAAFFATEGLTASDMTCDECEAQVTEWQDLYSNQTAVDELLAEMQKNCTRTYPLNPVNKKVCDAMAELYVQVALYLSLFVILSE